MTSEIENHRDVAIQIATIDYRAGGLLDTLLDFQRKQLTGIARVEAFLEDGLSQCTIVLREGAIAYAGRDIPTPYEFVTELGRQMHIGVLDTVLEFAAKRSSIQSVMRAMVEIGVLQWSEVAAANRQQAISVLNALLPVAGRIILESGPSTFDLHCKTAPAGSIVEALQRTNKLPYPRKEPAPLVNKKLVRAKPIILSVDDSPVAQALVKRALGDDYETISCSHAVEALSILGRRGDISMLLLDLTLPEMNGLEFCRLLRGMKQYNNLPIVMLTARNGMVDRMRGRLAGATHYLTKPVDPEVLAAIVAQYIAYRRLD